MNSKRIGVSNYSEEFEKLWDLYPRKSGKKIAATRYKKIKNKYTDEQIKNAILSYCEEVSGRELKYIKLGGAFFVSFLEEYIEKNNETIKEDEVYKYSNAITEIEHEVSEIETTDKEYNSYLNKLRSMKYADYILTEHWKHFRKEAIKFFNYKCGACGETKNTCIHHNNYENRGRETFNDVICLCDSCHKKIHGIEEQ